MCPASMPHQGVSTIPVAFLVDSHHTLGAPSFASCEINIQTRLTVDAKGGQQRLHPSSFYQVRFAVDQQSPKDLHNKSLSSQRWRETELLNCRKAGFLTFEILYLDNQISRFL